MIEKMNFLSITGPKTDIDRVAGQYLSKYEIHLENAPMELKTAKNISPYIQANPYKEVLSLAAGLIELLPSRENFQKSGLSVEASINLINDLEHTLTQKNAERAELKKQRDALCTYLEKIEPFRELNYDLQDIFKFKFIKFRFGKIAKESYSKFESYVYGNCDTVFFRCHEDADFIWGVYFCPCDEALKIDAVYASMHFERLYLPAEYEGSLSEIFEKLSSQMSELDKRLHSCDEELLIYLTQKSDDLLTAYEELNALSANFDIRKLAACTREDKETYYILCGWMTARDSAAFQKEIESDNQIYCFVEDHTDNFSCQPPTKLKNPKLFKPYEMYVRMFGLPAYNEIDPTIFVALTYSFIFGAMFGDVGQGLLLVIGGALLYKLKGIDLAAIISLAGIFSTAFGFLFGSFFGFEDTVIPTLWLSPLKAMMRVPGLGNMNTVFVIAIGFGMFLILITMILHIINAIRSRDISGILFDQNALSGFVFYGSLLTVAALFVSGHSLPAAAVLGIMFGLPLLLIMLKEPLARIIEKKRPAVEGGWVMYFVQSFFELFEVLLSYLSNTLSFVRIGAFAVSHAAMMEVVLMLAGAANGASPNWIVIVLGNLFVCAMEGLIVGIQVLRLEYYEMFSRFYKGNGKEFRPFCKKTN